ncbi:hypothetical protein EST38_g741 [Candolleomyces aberdarensis]|uniref:Major facilitator superfamily (MFS) profile domain-containing protein n=1 Tax=Candolleomyces aberdarensis TaxID=2316362 RepID=A0A4Q2DYV1_9AGAR|nr:hypothetical protein EST38_g741 [Candolleomyces aberdarensis]
MLRSPSVLVMALVAFLVLAVEYILLIPIAYTIGLKYNLTNEVFVGACFIPNGIGNMIGAPLAGRLSDRIVTQFKAKRGSWYPEDRLRVAILPALTLIPLSALASGILTTYVDGPVGLAGNLICLFVNGFGIDMVLSPCSAYLVDILHSESAETMAAVNAFRAVLLSFCIMGIFPMVENWGVLATDIIAALLGWLSFG